MMFGNVIKMSLGVMTLCLLVGCQEEYRIELASAGETIQSATFTVADIDVERITTVHTVRVYDQSESLVWHLKRDTAVVDKGLNTLRYGSAPEGFKVEVSPSPLKPGAAYTLVVQGRGYGVLRFATNSKGKLIALGKQVSGF